MHFQTVVTITGTTTMNETTASTNQMSHLLMATVQRNERLHQSQATQITIIVAVGGAVGAAETGVTV